MATRIRLFRVGRKKLPAYRMAAVTALGEANTPAARAALDALRNDKDKDVRELAYRVLLHSNTRRAPRHGVFHTPGVVKTCTRSVSLS